MANNLNFGGAPVILIRNKGTANAVKGFVARETVVSKNVTALVTNFLFQLVEYVQFVIAAAPPTGTIAWLNVSGVWKQLVVWLNVSGTWKTTTPNYNDGGTWK
jgi:hypothetical protein